MKNYKTTQKQMNKLIAKVDRYFTWDSRTIEVGEGIRVRNNDSGIYIHIQRDKYGMWCYLLDSKRNIKFAEHRKTFKEINDFIKMVKLIG